MSYYNPNRSGSISSAMSGITMNDIPNLPGYRKRFTSAEITLRKSYPNKMIQDSSNPLKEESFYSDYTDEDNNSIQSFFQGSIKDATMVNYPASVSSYQDISGRYGLRSQKEDRSNHRHHLPFIATNNIPNFIVSEYPNGKICRFFAYFFETNPDDPYKPLRTRKVHILYYLADDTIEIIEPKVNNSGSIQGKMLKRQRVPRPGSMTRPPSTKTARDLPRHKGNHSRLPPLPSGANEITASSTNYITKDDFYAGAEVAIYQIKYIITDCDVATKEYFENELKRPFGEPILDIPAFEYDFCYSDSKPGPVAYGSTVDSADPISGLTTENNSRRSSTIQETRLSTANITSMYTPESRSFYEYDKKILRFFGVWDNRKQLYGDRIFVQVHYYLADNTFEVIPIRERNSGRDDIGTILKRTKILKPSVYDLNMSSSLSVGSTGSVADFGTNLSNGSPYHWKDLTIGHRLRIAAVDILLTDADEFTRQFYSSKNCSLSAPINPPTDIDEVLSQTWESEDTNRAVSAAVIMSGKRAGYSSMNINGQYKPREGDPYALPPKGSLISEAPFKDGAKLKDLQGLILRYTAVIKNPSTTDLNRKFVIIFHCEDDCVEIKELTTRNSGHIGGHFATRSKIENKFTGRFLAPSDLFIDAEVNINGITFHIIDSDDLTLHYMENNCKTIWKSCDLQTVMKKIMVKKDVLVKLMLFTKGLATAIVSYDAIGKLCHLASLRSISKQEVYTLCRAVDPVSSKTVKLTKLLKFILEYKFEDWAET